MGLAFLTLLDSLGFVLVGWDFLAYLIQDDEKYIKPNFDLRGKVLIWFKGLNS